MRTYCLAINSNFTVVPLLEKESILKNAAGQEGAS